MPDHMRVRIKANGPDFWQLIVEDADTGKMLPVTRLQFGGDFRNGVLEADVTLLIHEVDIEADARVIEEIVKVGGIVRQPVGRG